MVTWFKVRLVSQVGRGSGGAVSIAEFEQAMVRANRRALPEYVLVYLHPTDLSALLVHRQTLQAFSDFATSLGYTAVNLADSFGEAGGGLDDAMFFAASLTSPVEAVDRTLHPVLSYPPNPNVRGATGFTPGTLGAGLTTESDAKAPLVEDKGGTSDAAKAAFVELAGKRYSPSAVDKLVAVLIPRTDSRNAVLREEVRKQSAAYVAALAKVQDMASGFHASRIFETKVAGFVKEANTDEERRKRAKFFGSLCEMFGFDVDEMTSKFDTAFSSYVDGVKKGVEIVRTQYAEEIGKVVVLAAEVEVKAKLLEETTRESSKWIRKAAEEHIKAISGMQFIKSYTVSNTTLELVYQDVKIQHAGNIYELGDYRVTIPLTSADRGEIRIRSEKHWAEKTLREHPHVVSGNNRGSVCWGNIAEGVSKLLTDWNWSLLAQILWSFLNSYNPFDKFMAIGDFARDAGIKPKKIGGGK